MKYGASWFSLALLIGLLVILADCSLPPANNPRSVAETFLNHLKAVEFKQAGELATDTSRQTLLYLESLKSSLPQDRIDQSKAKGVTIISVKEEGDKAMVNFRMGTDDEQALEMVKTAGAWKVDFKKQL